MKKMEELRDMLCEELEEIVNTGKIDMGDLEAVHKLTDTIKNIDKIEAMEGEGYSSDGDWRASGTYSRGRDSRYSYGRDSMRSNRGRGRYSRGEGNEAFMDHVEEMMQDDRLSSQEKSTLRKAMDILRK